VEEKDENITQGPQDLLETYCGLNKEPKLITEMDAIRFAERIDPDINLMEHRDPLIRRSAEMIGEISGKKALDIGTGEGRWARFLDSKGAIVTGIDSSGAFIGIAQARSGERGKIEYRHVLFEDLVDTEKFDFEMAVHVVGGVKDLSKFVKKMSEVASHGGEILLATKTVTVEEEHLGALRDYLIPLNEKGNATIYIYPRSCEDYISELNANGFEIVDISNKPATNTFRNDNLNALNIQIHDTVIKARKA
jgi:2-polyprenyl-3-methyl-5-hydroxy-6-metoxy-1,4-benzoquinol methylase